MLKIHSGLLELASRVVSWQLDVEGVLKGRVLEFLAFKPLCHVSSPGLILEIWRINIIFELPQGFYSIVDWGINAKSSLSKHLQGPG